MFAEYSKLVFEHTDEIDELVSQPSTNSTDADDNDDGLLISLWFLLCHEICTSWFRCDFFHFQSDFIMIALPTYI